MSTPNLEDEFSQSTTISKKAAKKEAAKQEKLRRRHEATASASAAASGTVDETDPLAEKYGDLSLSTLQSTDEDAKVSDWTEVGALTEGLNAKEVLIRGRVHTIRLVSKKMAFVVVREKGFTVQCVVTVHPELVSTQMVKYTTGLSRESIVEIEEHV